MSRYLVNLTDGQIDEKGIYWPLYDLLTQSGVLQSGALAVSAQGTPDMTVKVAGGTTGHSIAFLTTGGDLYYGRNTADETVTITANASGVTKKDVIVAYADLTAGSSTSNNPGALKFLAVRGSGTDTAPTSGEIAASAVGANPYVVLAHVSVANGASSINSGNITDQRTRSALGTDLVPTAAIQDSAITTAKIDSGAVTATKVNFGGSGSGVWWEEIGRTTLESASDTITVSGLSARKYLRIIFILFATGGSAGPQLRFNNDSGNNYTRRSALNGGAEAPQTSQSLTSAGIGANIAILGEGTIVNVASQEKLLQIHQVHHSTAGAGTVNERSEWTGKWANASTQITRIDMINGGSGDFATGSEVIILGHD